MEANGGSKNYPTGHAFDHSAPPRGDFCYWCGIHRDGLSRTDVIEAQGYTEENWREDREYLGLPIE